MNLKNHPRVAFLGLEAPGEGNHRLLNHIGGRALNWRVDGGTLRHFPTHSVLGTDFGEIATTSPKVLTKPLSRACSIRDCMNF